MGVGTFSAYSSAPPNTCIQTGACIFNPFEDITAISKQLFHEATHFLHVGHSDPYLPNEGEKQDDYFVNPTIPLEYVSQQGTEG